ncbi:hypothetical protein BV011_01460 [Haemophilus influenzae]|nr:hypothetical protein BV011_01460 [Haemophilus influenzae]
MRLTGFDQAGYQKTPLFLTALLPQFFVFYHLVQLVLLLMFVLFALLLLNHCAIPSLLLDYASGIRRYSSLIHNVMHPHQRGHFLT